MAASVRIDDTAFGDPRFDMLGGLLGTSKYDALGRCTHLWRYCTDRGADRLAGTVIAVFVDPEFLVASDLASRVKDRGDHPWYRVRGAKGRIEWLEKKRKASRKGGLATKAKSEARGGPSGLAPPGQREGPPAPAPAPAPAQRSKVSEPLVRGSTEMAEYLRKKILSDKPDHRLRSQDRWRTLGPKWAKVCDAILRIDERDMHRTKEILDWVFGDQGGGDHRFVVESPKALREKWDRIDREIRPAPGHAQPQPRKQAVI